LTTAAVRYVKPTPSGTQDCTNWANACNLNTALSNPPSGDEIWVQAGTYSAGPYALANGVKTIGGFAGTETAASESNPTAKVTIVDGGLVAPGVTNINSTPGALAALLRGFKLRNGRDTDDEGGGIVLENSNALFVDCTIEENSAAHFGGAVAIRGTGSPQFINCAFRKNGKAATTSPRDTKGGGAVFARGGTPLFVNCVFENNKAGEGGVYHGVDGYPTFINCTMADNHATDTYGGAIYDQGGRVTLKNSILWNNTTTRGVGYADAIMSGSGGTTLVIYSNIQGGWTTGSNNISADPLFTGYYRLQSASPCKNAGDNNVLPPDTGDLDWDGNTVEQIPKDFDMLLRVRAGTVDIGAIEQFGSGGGGGQ
jgi:hypothetical protein